MDKLAKRVVLVGNVGRPPPPDTDLFDNYRACVLRGLEIMHRQLSSCRNDRQGRYLLDLRYEGGDLLEFMTPEHHRELLAELDAQIRWRASVESLCGGNTCAFHELDKFGVLMLDVLTAMAGIYQVIEQPHIHWPRPSVPKQLGPKPSTKVCRRIPRSRFFSASKSNLRNAP